MTIERKVGMGIAGQPSGGPTDVADVFSTHLYRGTSGSLSVNNGIDLAGEGGMVWTKQRSRVGRNSLVDTERGNTKHIFTDSNAAEGTTSDSITAFNSNGYNLGGAGGGKFNTANEDHVSWTFRKKKKFFDIVTYTGSGSVSTGQGAQSIAHSLGSVPAMIIFKSLTTAQAWPVYNKDIGNQQYLNLSSSSAKAASASDMFNATSPTTTHFTVGVDNEINKNGESYVAYIFADNSSEDAEEQMIKVGTYTGNQSATGPVVNLGWEPQWLMVKQTTLYSDPLDWIMVDNMRGWETGSTDERLYANSNAAENGTEIGIDITSTGFKLTTNGEATNKNNAVYIYMAIRAPMMVEPSAATDVYSAVNYTGDGTYDRNITGFTMTPDMIIESRYNNVSNHHIFDRKRGWSNGDLYTNDTSVENPTGDGILQNNSVMNSIKITDSGTNYLNSNSSAYNINAWKRAKGFFDVVAYTGTGSNRTIPHSLGVVPEMIWVKSRSNVKSWGVYHPSSHAAGNTIFIDNNHAGAGVGSFQDGQSPSATTFNVDTAEYTNESGWKYIAYLFATLDGISKIGSYTGNGSSQTIACGFSAGSRFILIKRVGATGSWYVWDSVRGIATGDEPNIFLDTSSDQNTTDSVDPHNSGFIVNQVSSASGGQSATNINVSSATYIFYAIA